LLPLLFYFVVVIKTAPGIEPGKQKVWRAYLCENQK